MQACIIIGLVSLLRAAIDIMTRKCSTGVDAPKPVKRLTPAAAQITAAAGY